MTDAGLLLALAGLALVDSTSLGTLLVPVWLMLAPGLRISRFLTYLATVSGFYFAVGVVLVVGAGAIQRALLDVGDSDTVSWIQLAVGVGLFVLSFRYEPKRQARREARHGGPDRAQRWRARVSGRQASSRAMILLGLGAAGLEVMTMLPYLAAVGLISTADLAAYEWFPLLLAYVVVMVLPALVLLGARSLGRTRVEPALERMSAWMSRHTAGALGWVLGIVGFLLAADAVNRLALFAPTAVPQ